MEEVEKFLHSRSDQVKEPEIPLVKNVGQTLMLLILGNVPSPQTINNQLIPIVDLHNSGNDRKQSSAILV